MENEKLNSENQESNRFEPFKYRRFGGLVIILAGIILLLRHIPQTANFFPEWLFTWQVLLIAIGIFVGAMHGFRRSFGWLVLIIIGLGFLLYQQRIITAPLDRYILPIALIIVGLIFIFNKRHYSYRLERWKRKQQRWQEMSGYFENKRERFFTDSNDYININASFRSMEKRILSKKFQGGIIKCSFGSCELDLTQIDFEQAAIIDISLNFGSIEIMLPSNWAVQNEMSSVLSEVDDARMKTAATFEKTIILKGNVSFGSVEIRN